VVVMCSFLAAWEVHTHGLGGGFDLSGDGVVDGSDAAFPFMHIAPGAFFDVTGDGSFTMRDALIVMLTVAVVVVAFRSGYDAEEAARQMQRADTLEQRLERQRRVAEDRLDRWVIAQRARDALEREITQLEDRLQQGQAKASGADERIDELRRQLDKVRYNAVHNSDSFVSTRGTSYYSSTVQSVIREPVENLTYP
jgi:septal ring factor EnvC (AmiA/AmiB activator)